MEQIQSETREISLIDLALLVARRKLLILSITGGMFVVSVAYALTLPNIYSSTARVLPPQKEGGSGLSALLGQAGGLVGLAGGSLGGNSDLYLGILKSRSVGDAVIQRLELQKLYHAKSIDEARQLLSHAVKVQAEKDGLISITAEDKDPKRSAILANAFVDELGVATVRLNLTKAGSERIFLEKRLEVVKRDLQAAENDLKRYSQQHKIVQVDAQAKASIEGVARLKADLAGKEVQLSVLRSKQTDQSPEVKAMLAAIDRLKAEIGGLSGSGGGGGGIPTVGSVPAVGLEFARKTRELKIQETLFEQLTKQYELAKLNAAKDASSVQVLDEAVPPITKSKPSRSLIVALATVSAFFVSVIVSLILDYLHRLPSADRAALAALKRSITSFR